MNRNDDKFLPEYHNRAKKAANLYVIFLCFKGVKA